MTFLTGDAEVRRIAELRDKWEMDWNTDMYYAKEEGIQEGEKKGKRKAKLETAKKMLEKKIDVQTICEITGLTKEEILELK